MQRFGSRRSALLTAGAIRMRLTASQSQALTTLVDVLVQAHNVAAWPGLSRAGRSSTWPSLAEMNRRAGSLLLAVAPFWCTCAAFSARSAPVVRRRRAAQPSRPAAPCARRRLTRAATTAGRLVRAAAADDAAASDECDVLDPSPDCLTEAPRRVACEPSRFEIPSKNFRHDVGATRRRKTTRRRGRASRRRTLSAATPTHGLWRLRGLGADARGFDATRRRPQAEAMGCSTEEECRFQAGDRVRVVSKAVARVPCG